MEMRNAGAFNISRGGWAGGRVWEEGRENVLEQRERHRGGEWGERKISLSWIVKKRSYKILLEEANTMQAGGDGKDAGD